MCTCECLCLTWCPFTSDGQSRSRVNQEQWFQTEGDLMMGLKWMFWPSSYTLNPAAFSPGPKRAWGGERGGGGGRVQRVKHGVTAVCFLLHWVRNMCITVIPFFSLQSLVQVLTKKPLCDSCGSFPGFSQTLTLCVMDLRQAAQMGRHLNKHTSVTL